MQKMPSRPQNPATAAGIRSVPSPKRSNTKRRNAWRPEIFSFDENIIPCTPFYLVSVSNIHPYFNFSFTRSSRLRRSDVLSVCGSAISTGNHVRLHSPSDLPRQTATDMGAKCFLKRKMDQYKEQSKQPAKVA